MIEVKTLKNNGLTSDVSVHVNGDMNTLLNEAEVFLIDLYGSICANESKGRADEVFDQLFARVKMTEEERTANTKETNEKIDKVSENLAKLLKMDTDEFLDFLMKGLEREEEDELS